MVFPLKNGWFRVKDDPGRILTHLLPGLLFLATACGSTMAYLRGAPPPSALPRPEITVTVTSPEGLDTVWNQELAMEGMVSRVIVGPAPGYGFKLEIVGDDRVVVLNARTWHDGLPDFTEGRVIALEFHPDDDHRLTIWDAGGPLFYLADGKDAPLDQSGLPVTFSVTEKTAYYEARMSESLCRQTVSHWFVKVRTTGDSTPLAPGETRVVMADGLAYLVVAADSFQVEESDCGNQGTAATTLFWLRMAENAPKEETPH